MMENHQPKRMPLVSILVPAYNEEEFIPEVLSRVLRAPLPEGVEREVLVVDDGSTDGTAAAALEAARRANGLVRVLRHERNRGKGAAVRTALAEARGEFSLIQDADLEYDPRDYPKLLEPLLEGRADAVYGSRFAVGTERRVLYYWHSVANRWLTALANIASDLNLTDVWTGYKAFRTSLVRSIPLRSDGFSFEAELTIKLAQREAVIYETPVRYHGRTYEEGKKIRRRDALLGLLAVLWYSLRRDVYKEAAPEILDRLAMARRFNAWMADTVAPYAGRRVLEIGAGIGNLTRRLAPGRVLYVASDIDEEHLARLAARMAHRPNVRVARADLARAEDFEPLRESVDTVICLNVVEHVEDDVAALRNLRTALLPGGRAIVLVPEGQSIFGELDVVLGHWRRYSEAELREKMQRAGFEVERIFGFNRVTRPGWWLNGRILRRRTFSRLQLWLFDHLVWLWRRVDGWLPWPGVSLIAIGRKPGADQTR
ncbi:MAG: glycosyltransferase [Bryobacteraceae bacterium]